MLHCEVTKIKHVLTKKTQSFVRLFYRVLFVLGVLFVCLGIFLVGWLLGVFVGLGFFFNLQSPCLAKQDSFPWRQVIRSSKLITVLCLSRLC